MSTTVLRYPPTAVIREICNADPLNFLGDTYHNNKSEAYDIFTIDMSFCQ